MRNIKTVFVGTGKMAKYTMRYVYEKKGTICGAFDINKNVIGKDIGSIIESDDKGIIVEDVKNLELRLKELKPDICIVETMSLLADLDQVLLTCAFCGINAITTCEEAFFSYNSNPTLTKRIDEVAKENNCTITGSGYQDIYWGQLISSIAGSTQSIKMIKGSSSYNVEDYGIALAKAHGASLSLDRFDDEIASVDRMSDEERNKIINSGKYLPSYMWNTNGWLADKLGLTVISQTQECVPTTYDEDIVSKTLDMTIKKGDATGMRAIVTTKTKEGITIQSECVGKVYGPDDFDKNCWSVIGEPDTTITVERPRTVELTCASIVNRLSDVIEAPSGFVPTSRLGELTFKDELLINE